MITSVNGERYKMKDLSSYKVGCAMPTKGEDVQASDTTKA